MKCLLIPVLLLSFATGCGSLKPKDFSASSTHFEPDTYFTGHVRSWGVMENRSGEPRRKFTTDSVGKKEANGDTMIRQVFTHQDGSTQERIWHVHKVDSHHFEGTANDVVGVAKGVADGNVFRWEYTIALKPGNPLANVHLRQWMYQPEGNSNLFTRVLVTKWGLKVGQVTESFEKLSSD
jgi:hypothetical protein